MYRIVINKQPVNKKSVVTIGNFDGLHLGHMQLIKELNQIACAQDYRRILITFIPLPHDYFALQKHGEAQAKLCLLRDKWLILKQANLIDELVVLRFNATFAHLSPREFIQQILINELNTAHVVVGSDFRFGCERQGTIDDCTLHNLATSVVSPLMLDNQRVSSSLIRKFASVNELAKLKCYLGRNLQYTARVVRGAQLGRQFGVPTINLNLNGIYPAVHGIYVARVYIGVHSYNAVASIGTHPTVSNSTNYKLEAHLLDIVNCDLYGTIATVEILHFLREEIDFTKNNNQTPDLKSLFVQIDQDIANARKYFAGMDA